MRRVRADVDVPGDVLGIECRDVPAGRARGKTVEQLGVGLLAGKRTHRDGREAVVYRSGDRRYRRRRRQAPGARTEDDDSQGEVQQSLHDGH
jgi:hypothetical protein